MSHFQWQPAFYFFPGKRGRKYQLPRHGPVHLGENCCGGEIISNTSEARVPFRPLSLHWFLLFQWRQCYWTHGLLSWRRSNVSKILSICDREHILLYKQQHMSQTCRDRGSNESFCTTAEGLCAQGERHKLRIWACLTSFHPVGTQPSAAKLQETVIQLSTEIHLPRAQASQLASVGVSSFMLQNCSGISMFFRYINWERRKIGDLGLEKSDRSCDRKYFHFQQVCTFTNIYLSLLWEIHLPNIA